MIEKLNNLLTGVEIGPNVIACDFAAKRLLNRDYPLRRNRSAMQPHGDMRLTNGLASQLSEPGSHSVLAAGLLDCRPKALDGFGHGTNHNTDSVIRVNTHSVVGALQTSGMPREDRETDFWKRLKAARTTCNPPKSMLQRVLVKEYPEFAAHQSTVTKWKTGGEDGTTMPRPEVVLKMAADTGVNFNWLFSGEGEMRSQPTPDSITQQIIEAVHALPLPGKIEVLKEAIAQQTIQLPAVAARIQEAQRQAEAKTATKRHKRR
jgi:hypothetical protein